MKYIFENGNIRIQTNGAYRNRPLSAFLDDYCQSDKNRYLFLQNRQILVDGKEVSSFDQILNDEEITVIIPEEDYGWPLADEPCQVIYEDPFVMIVYKEAGVIIHDDIHPETCLNAMAASYLHEKGIRTPVRPVHRLDRDTQGLVLYSKIPFFQPWLDSQMSQKKIIRQYLAVCYGKCPPGTKFTCNGAIGRDRHRSGAYRISKTGKEARTNVLCKAQRGRYALFECILDTGRTHQIRVHLADKGYPIVNDPLYGVISKDFEHMGLYAQQITFRSPLTRKKHRISGPSEPDLTYFISADQEEMQ